MILLSSVHLLFGIFVISMELLKLKKEKMNILFFAMITYGTFFGIAPAILHFTNLVGYNHKWVSYMNYDNQHYYVELLLVIVTYFFLIFGWKLKLRRRKEGELKHKVFFFSENLFVIAWLFLIVSFVAYIIYSRAYGGFVDLLNLSNAIRGGFVDVYNKWSFLQRFGGFSLISSYLFFSLIASGEKKYSFHNKIGFAFSFMFSIYILLTWEGRLTLVYYIITFPIANLILKSKRIKLVKLFGLFVIFAFILYSSSIIFKYIKSLISGVSPSVKNKSSILDFFVAEFSFPTVSIGTSLHAIYDGLINIRYFKDIPLGFVHLVPKSILGYIPEKISTINTNLFATGLQGEIPTDIISLGVYSLGIFGPLILAFILGVVCRLSQDYLNKFEQTSLKSIGFVVIGLVLGRIVVYADPANFLNGNFSLIVSITVLLVFKKTRAYFD